MALNFQPSADIDYRGTIGGVSATNIADAGKSVAVTVDNQAISYSVSGVATPANINITAIPKNIATPYYTFSRNTGSGTFTEIQAISTDSTLTAYSGIPPKDTAYQFKADVYGSPAGSIIASDYVTIYGIASGSDAITIILSNESHSISAASDGTTISTDYIGSGTTIRVFEGSVELAYNGVGTTNSTWAATATPNGITTGSFTDSGAFLTVGDHSSITSAVASILYTITGKRQNGTAFSFGKTQSFTRTNQGSKGFNVAQVYAYKRVNVAPTDNPGPVEYTFSSSSITSPVSLQNTWSKTIPSGTSPIYVTVASASSISPTDNIGSPEWAAPVLLSQNGLNVATVFLYKRTTTNVAPTPINGVTDTTYTFSSGGVTSPPTGWTTSIPSTGGNYIWATQATASNTNTTDSILIGEWATPPVLSSQIGTDGAPGADGTDGAPGAPGADGAPGANGAPGFFFLIRSGTSTSTATPGSALGAPDGSEVPTPVNGHSAIVQNQTPVQTAWRRTGGAWVQETSFIRTGLIASNAIVTEQLLISNLKAATGTGIFMDSTNNRIDIWASNALRVRIGNLSPP